MSKEIMVLFLVLSTSIDAFAIEINLPEFELKPFNEHLEFDTSLHLYRTIFEKVDFYNRSDYGLSMCGGVVPSIMKKGRNINQNNLTFRYIGEYRTWIPIEGKSQYHRVFKLK